MGGGWLSRLKNAVNKIRFLLNFDLNKLKLASIFKTTSSPVKRRVSFNDRPGLRGFMDDPDYSNGSGSGSGSGSITLRRTMSSPFEDDIDKRAEMFIANFYQQLRIERQISLELRYARNNYNNDDSPSP